MRSLRVQLSLIFSDEELFDDFIIPLRDNKELSGMIIQLLTSYYYNENVRNAIEGVSLEEISDENERVMDSSDAFNSIRQNLAMQDFLLEQAKQVLEDGASEMDALMKANDVAMSTGVVKTEETDVGERLVQITMKNPISDSKSEEAPQHSNNSDLEERVTRIENRFDEVLILLKSIKESQDSSSSSSNESTVKVDVKPETVSKIEPAQVSTTEVNSTPVLKEEPVIAEPVNEDASDELNDVLADLLN